MHIKQKIKSFREYWFYVFVWISFLRNFATAAATHLAHCSALQWQCDSGACIKIDELCDGMAHCVDNSDESAEHCIHRFCPPYAFRCAYGACITGTTKCNGFQDCHDNSDETGFLCSRDIRSLERQLIGNCSRALARVQVLDLQEGETLRMQCKSGECIRMDQRCDGLKDCLDGSDETVDLCSYLYCPSYAFRCGYGGCIRGNAKCDGFSDCIDGSDEASELCGYKRRPEGEKRPITVKPTPTSQNGCLIPFNRRSLLARYIYDEPLLLPLGTRVSENSQILFFCERGWALIGYAQNLCLENNNWRYSVASCIKLCSHITLAKGISTTVSCFHENKTIDCAGDLHTGTTAHIRCAPGYELPVRKPKINTLTCDADGEWDYPKFKCKPQCGVLEQVESKPVSIINRPWHATVYARLFDGTQQRICGGTIITPNLIITAANCFMKMTPEQLQDEAIFYGVMLGHHLQELHANEYRIEDLYNISQILLPDYDYPISNDAYHHKIALLALVNPLNLSNIRAKPICLKPFNHYEAHSEIFHKLQLNRQQQMDLGFISTGYSFDEIMGGCYYLDGIVEEFDEKTGMIDIINVNYYKIFLRKIIRRYKYIY